MVKVEIVEEVKNRGVFKLSRFSTDDALAQIY